MSRKKTAMQKAAAWRLADGPVADAADDLAAMSASPARRRRAWRAMISCGMKAEPLAVHGAARDPAARSWSRRPEAPKRKVSGVAQPAP
jgi:hypothetical protein